VKVRIRTIKRIGIRRKERESMTVRRILMVNLMWNWADWGGKETINYGENQWDRW
jgi:hypothetical protein